jgi:hypothetical protein
MYLYIHSSIHVKDIAINYLITRTSLPSFCLTDCSLVPMPCVFMIASMAFGTFPYSLSGVLHNSLQKATLILQIPMYCGPSILE